MFHYGKKKAHKKPIMEIYRLAVPYDRARCAPPLSLNAAANRYRTPVINGGTGIATIPLQ